MLYDIMAALRETERRRGRERERGKESEQTLELQQESSALVAPSSVQEMRMCK